MKLRKNLTSPQFSWLITAIFSVIVMFGLVHHEMWREEFKPWLIARNADTASELFNNMSLSGDIPSFLWHFLLFLITRTTHNIVFIPVLNFIFACGFIFVFNRYSAMSSAHKVMVSFGYFTLYEYSIVNGSYGLTLLLIFSACALYKNRSSHYILLGTVLAILSMTSIYGLIFSASIAIILMLDYKCYQIRSENEFRNLIIGLVIIATGILFSIYLIIPGINGFFANNNLDHFSYLEQWSFTLSRIFTTYFYIPRIDGMNFWNTNFFFNNDISINGIFLQSVETHYLWLFPVIIIALTSVVFVRKPIILLLYITVTSAVLFLLRYSNLFSLEYCGFLLIIFIICCWLHRYYPSQEFKNRVLSALARYGEAIETPLISAVLTVNMLGAIIAYAKDYEYKFSVSKDVANYIHENKLDTFAIAGISDCIVSPLAAYLDTNLFYFQTNDHGSFYAHSNESNKIERAPKQIAGYITRFMNQVNNTFLLVASDTLFTMSHDYVHFVISKHGYITKDIKYDLVKYFKPGVVADEKYFIYLIQKEAPDNLTVFQNLLKNDSRNSDVQCAIGDIYMTKQMYESAEAYYNMDIHNYEDPVVMMHIGNIYGNTNRYPQALAKYKAVIDREPTYMKAYSNIGRIYFATEEYKKAMPYFKMIFAMDPLDLSNNSFIARSYKALGMNDSADKYEAISYTFK